jgi:hypothetical protein
VTRGGRFPAADGGSTLTPHGAETVARATGQPEAGTAWIRSSLFGVRRPIEKGHEAVTRTSVWLGSYLHDVVRIDGEYVDEGLRVTQPLDRVDDEW